MSKFFEIIGSTFWALVIACCLILLGGFIVMLLWNWIVPDLFNSHTITVWQGFGLYLLCALLFNQGKIGRTSESKSE